MRAVFLDTDTLGPEDIDLAPLTNRLPSLVATIRTDVSILKSFGVQIIPKITIIGAFHYGLSSH